MTSSGFEMRRLLVRRGKLETNNILDLLLLSTTLGVPLTAVNAHNAQHPAASAELLNFLVPPRNWTTARSAFVQIQPLVLRHEAVCRTSARTHIQHPQTTLIKSMMVLKS